MKCRTSRLQRNLSLLHSLNEANLARRTKLLKAADRDLVKTLCDCCRNILNGNVTITPARQKTLIRHKNVVRFLGEKKDSYGKRKQFVQNQSGGILSALLPAILSPVLSVAEEIIGQNL